NLRATAAELQRQQNGERRMSGNAFTLDRAVMLGDESLRDREPQSAATLATGYERKEDAVTDRVGNARPVVLDQQRQRQAVPPLGQRYSACDAGRQADLRNAEHTLERLRRVAHDIEYRLRQLLGIAFELGQA